MRAASFALTFALTSPLRFVLLATMSLSSVTSWAAAVKATPSSNGFAIVKVPVRYQAAANDERKFLMRLGFEDYSLQAQATLRRLENNPKISPIVKPILENNYDRTIPVSYAREAAVLARVGLERAHDRHTEGTALAQLTALTTYHLLPFALVGLQPIPTSVYNFKVGPPAKALRTAYLKSETSARYLAEKKAFIATFISLLFTELEITRGSSDTDSAIKQLDQIATQILHNEYEITGLQQSRFLGRALAATLIRFARINGYPEIETQLRNSLAAQGQFLDNHISSTLTLRDRKGVLQKVEVFNGDVANEYSTAAEAYQITAGVMPAAENRAQAQSLKLIGSLADFGSAMSDKLVESATEKKWSNQALNDDEARVLSEIWDPRLIRGFSHAGVAEVRRDAASGIAMVWIWDVYPGDNLAGMRFQTPENFAYAERYNRIGFVHYSPEKALAVFKKQIQSRGYLPNVWESAGANLARDAEDSPTVTVDPDRRVLRATYVDEQSVQSWTEIPKEQAAAWYYGQVVPRALKMIRSYLTGEDALVFAAEFKNFDHSAYCSQMIVLAYLQGANFDLQAYPDEWRGVTKIAAKLTPKLSVKERIISPSGFAWQKDLTETVRTIDLDRSGVFAQTENAPFLNGKPTVISQRLQILAPLLKSTAAQALADQELTELDPDTLDVNDDEL